MRVPSRGDRSTQTIITRRFARIAAAVGAVTVALAGCAGSTADSRSATSTSTSPAAVSSVAGAPTTVAPPRSAAPTAAQTRARVDKAVGRLVADQPKHAVSVAALNTATGAQYSYGSRSGLWTASVYKLLVLEVLLHQQRGALTGAEDEYAELMIKHSDNAAGYSAFLAAGGRPGLIAGAKALGLIHTVPGVTDPTFTTTGAPDLVVLLGNLVRKGPLTRSARTYALDLMRDVESDQRWGVGVIADKGTDFANKNGWLSIGPGNAAGENDGGLWAVNSVGVVTVNGRQVLIAVMTRHQTDFGSGMKLVEQLARAVRPAIAS